MSLKYLNLTGLSRVITNLKNWVVSQIPTKTSEITNDSGFINNTDNCVHKTGDETVAGEKTFTADTYITSASRKYLQIKNTSWDLGQATPSSDKEFGGICFKDKDNQNASYIITYEYASGYGCLRLLYRTKFSNGEKSTSGSNVDSQFTIGIMPDGKVYCGTNGYWHTNLIPTVNNSITLGNSTYRWKAVYANSYYLGNTAFGDIVTHNASEFLTSHQTVSNSAPTLAWGATATIGTIGGTALTVKMPANPNTNTTYSAGTGLSLSGTTFSLALTKALVTDALGYTPPTTDTNTDTKVTQTATTGDSFYPVLATTTANALTTETNTARFNPRFLMNTRYGYLVSVAYNSDNLKGATAGGTRSTGGMWWQSYDNAEVGRIWNHVTKDGTRETYIRVTSYITNGTLATDGTAVNAYLSVGILPTGAKRIATDADWACNLTPITTNTYTLGTSSLYWKAAYVITQYMGGDIVFNGTYNLRSNADNSYVRIQGGSGEGKGSRIILSGKTRSGLQGYAEIVATDGTNTNTFTVKPNGETLVNGNNLAATIIKGLSISGKTITYTQINGSTGTLTTQDTVYTHPTSAGNKHIPSGGSSGQILKYSSSGTAAWADTDFARTMAQIATRTSVSNGTWTITSEDHQLIMIVIHVTGTSASTTHKVSVTLSSGADALVPNTASLVALSSTSSGIYNSYYCLLWTTSTSVKITISNVTALNSLSLTAYQ